MAKEGKGKKGDTIKHTPETHSLPCKLNTEQIAEAAENLASALQEVETIEIEKKAVMKDYNSQIDNCKKRIHRLMTHVKNGVEYRPVECDLQFHIKKVLAILVRKDTGDVVEERPMSDEEKQMQIEFAEEDSKDSGSDQAKMDFDRDDYTVNNVGVVENPSVLKIELPKTYRTKIEIRWARHKDGWYIGYDVCHSRGGGSSPVHIDEKGSKSFKTFPSALESAAEMVNNIIAEIQNYKYVKQVQTKVIKTVENYLEGMNEE